MGDAVVTPTRRGDMAASGLELGFRRIVDVVVERIARSLDRPKVVASPSWGHSTRLDLSRVAGRRGMAMLAHLQRESRRSGIDASP